MVTLTSEKFILKNTLRLNSRPRLINMIKYLNSQKKNWWVLQKKHQESEQIKEELVTISSKKPCLSEATEVINKIPVKLPSQLLINKIPTSFDKNFDPLSMNNRFEDAKF